MLAGLTSYDVFQDAIDYLVELIIVDYNKETSKAVLQNKLIETLVANLPNYCFDQVILVNYALSVIVELESIKKLLLSLNGFAELAKSKCKASQGTSGGLGLHVIPSGHLRVRNPEFIAQGIPRVLRSSGSTWRMT